MSLENKPLAPPSVPPTSLVLGIPTLRILQGPPGTGKTYLAAREAVAIVDGGLPAPDEVSNRHRQLVDLGRIVWVTFHPSYSYEDFVEGFRPVEAESGSIEYRVVDGPFKRACQACLEGDPRALLRVEQRIDGYKIEDIDSGGVALLSTPERKDRVGERALEYVDFWTIEYLRSRGITPDDLSIAGKDYKRRRAVAQKAEVHTTFLTNSSRHAALWRRMDELKASATATPVVLVIDEINRADLSRVFGELITLMEPDKREGATEERRVLLPYSKKLFSVPPNLHIIATMNTADRSLAIMDVALRRRFEFQDVEPDPSLCAGPEEAGGIDLRKDLERWNARITALLTRDLRLGHSELMPQRLEEVRVANAWADDEDGQSRAVAQVIRRRVLPQLLEYFHEDWRRAEVVLGRQGLLQSLDVSEVAALASDVFELAEDVSFTVPAWWDPTSGEWDAAKFTAALNEALGAEGDSGSGQ